MAEDLVKTGDRGDVELISASTRGFVVSTINILNFVHIFFSIYIISF